MHRSQHPRPFLWRGTVSAAQSSNIWRPSLINSASRREFQAERLSCRASDRAHRRCRQSSFCLRSAAMAIVWDYSARNRRQKLRKFTPANVTPPKSRDHAVPGLYRRGGLSQCPRLGTSRSHVRLAGQSSKTPEDRQGRRNSGTWWRSRRRRQPSRRRSTPTLSRLCDSGGPFRLRLCRARASRIWCSSGLPLRHRQ